MSVRSDNGKPFTGYHMLAWIISFFTVIIAVNLLMAYYANSTWSGLVVKNSYVASQEFNGKVADVKAQEALGWTGKLSLAKGQIIYALNSQSGKAVEASDVKISLRRPVTDTADVTITMSQNSDGSWSSAHVLNDGAWIAILDANTTLANSWRETLRFTVKDGAIK